MQEIEKILFNQCQNRTLPTDEEIQSEMFDSEEEILPAYYSCNRYDAPRITRDNAVSLLYRHVLNLFWIRFFLIELYIYMYEL